MVDLSTTYMGLRLNNPLVVASCSLTKTLKGIVKCAEAGAGAVVVKSLFEEQIKAEVKDLQQSAWISGHSEAIDYMRNIGRALGPQQYIELIKKAKQEVAIPVIASLNCITAQGYLDFAEKIITAGADAIELNISIMPVEPQRKSSAIEDMYLEVVEKVSKRVSIPIAVKVGPYFTTMAHMAHALCERGAAALVLFNRFFHPDIDIDNISLMTGYRFSTPDEIGVSLRWIALLAGRLPCDFAASTGVHDGAGVIKQLLAGANAVQVCSVLYLEGMQSIAAMLAQLNEWMEKHSFSSIDQFQGTLSQMETDRPELFERLQYIKTFVDID